MQIDPLSLVGMVVAVLLVGVALGWAIFPKSRQETPDLGFLQQQLTNLNNQVGQLQGLVTALQSQASDIPSLSTAVTDVQDKTNRISDMLISRNSGRAGEAFVEEQLSFIPDSFLKRDVVLKNGTVEFAVVLGPYLVPLDSKLVGADLQEQLNSEQDDARRKQVEKQIESNVRKRAKDLLKYVTDSKTWGFGIAAIPDSAYDVCQRCIKETATEGVVIVPYSRLANFVVSLCHLGKRLGIAVPLENIHRELPHISTLVMGGATELENMQKEIKSVEGQRSAALRQLNDALERLNFVPK